MPRYHFHSADGGREQDRTGTELVDDDAARHMAVAFAGEVLKLNSKQIWDKGTWRVEVTNDENVMLFTVITLVVDAPTPAGPLAISSSRW